MRWPDFRNGWVPAPDQGDLAGFSVWVNLDTYDTVENTGVTVRPAVGHYDGFDLAQLPNPSGYIKERAYLWDHGIDRYARCALLVFRSASPLANGQYTFMFYTNAPYATLESLGVSTIGVAYWQQLGTATGDDVNVSVSGGAVRILTGPHADYLILIDLLNGGTTTRTYCTAGLSIARTTSRTATAGAGGNIFNGWLLDYGKLYQPWTAPRLTPSIVLRRDDTNGVPINMSDVLNFAFLLAPIYDGTPEQIGVPWGYVTLPQLLLGVGLTGGGFYSFDVQFTSATGYLFSPRITGIAVYARVLMSDGYGSKDFSRLGTVPISALPVAGAAAATVFTIDGGTWQNHEGSWAADTGGRPLPEFDSASGAYAVFSSATMQAEEEAITVRARGIVSVKETQYAWGTAADPGGTRIRYSVLAGQFGQYDVFPKEQVMWKRGATHPITALVEWDGRILEIHETGVYFVDPPDWPRHDNAYIYNADSLGGGIGRAFMRTLAVGNNGVFFANHWGIYAFRSERVVNIAENRVLTAWRALSDETREAAVAGFNSARNEYWITVRSGHGTDESPYRYRYWIWRDDDVKPGWRVVELPDYLIPRGFVTDHEKRFLVYGPTTGANQPWILEYDKRGESLDLGTLPIAYSLSSQPTGNRGGELIITALDLMRQCDTDHIITMLLYINPNPTTGLAATTAGFRWVGTRGLHDSLTTIKEIRCQTVIWNISGTYSGGTRPIIQEIVLRAVNVAKRRR